MSDAQMPEHTGDEYRTEELFVADIKVGKRLRDIDTDKIVPLRDSVGRLGLLDPITVREANDGEFVLVYGLHRLEAFKSLGRAKITCHIVQIDARTARLWELAENLHRVELTVLQRSEQIDEWIQLTADQLAEQPKGDVSAQSDPKPQGGRPEGGIRAASRALGVDRSKARRARKRVAGIPPEIRDKIRTMQGVKGVDLDALVSAPPERQSAALDAVESGEAKNVREALARLKADGLQASSSLSPSSTTGPQPDLPFSEPAAPTQLAVKDLQGEESKARPSPIPGEAEPRKPETNVTTEGATAPPVSPLEPEPSGSLEPPKPSATPAAPPQTAATEGESEDSPINDLTMHTMCIPLEPIAQTWDDERVATAVSRLSHAAWCAPDAPEAGTGDPAAAAAQTIAELVAWTHRLQKGRTNA